MRKVISGIAVGILFISISVLVCGNIVSLWLLYGDPNSIPLTKHYAHIFLVRSPWLFLIAFFGGIIDWFTHETDEERLQKGIKEIAYRD